jgi:hypothetical protein
MPDAESSANPGKGLAPNRFEFSRVRGSCSTASLFTPGAARDARLNRNDAALPMAPVTDELEGVSGWRWSQGNVECRGGWSSLDWDCRPCLT